MQFKMGLRPLEFKFKSLYQVKEASPCSLRSLQLKLKLVLKPRLTHLSLPVKRGRAMGQCFEDLDVWKRSKQLAVEVCRAASACRDWGFKDQILRSAISVPSNIAEGAERNGKKEFAQFLGIARGSLGELRTQIIIGEELNYLVKDKSEEWIAETRELSRMVYALTRSLQKSV